MGGRNQTPVAPTGNGSVGDLFRTFVPEPATGTGAAVVAVLAILHLFSRGESRKLRQR